MPFSPWDSFDYLYRFGVPKCHLISFTVREGASVYHVESWKWMVCSESSTHGSFSGCPTAKGFSLLRGNRGSHRLRCLRAFVCRMGGVGLGHRKKWPTAQITTSCGWKSLTPSMAHGSKWHIIHVNLCRISSINRPDLLKGQRCRHPIRIIFSPCTKHQNQGVPTNCKEWRRTRCPYQIEWLKSISKYGYLRNTTFNETTYLDPPKNALEQ